MTSKRKRDDDFELVTVEQPRSAARHAEELRLTWKDARGAHAVPVRGNLLLGSSAECTIALSDPAVSRLHAELSLRDGGVWVRDLGSKNGTFIQNLQIASARLPVGGKLRLGSTELELRGTEAAAQPELWPHESFGPLLGKSAAMRALFAQLARCAQSDATVLLHGETGTGKELVARALHEASPRASAPLVVIDCAGLPETLLEAELFGHARGAFTGAVDARRGAFEEAEGGTIFLDEIGELPLAMQPKLLRALESRTVRRLGEAQHRKIDVRFVSATHRDLREMVNAGAFREDLYFRLAVIPLEIPALRQRVEDVPLLARHFLQGRAELPPKVVQELTQRSWLGNVRELRNFVERALALGAEKALESPRGPASASRGDGEPALDGPLKEARERVTEWFEREYVKRLLEKHKRDIPAAAAEAGVDRTYIYRLVRKYGI